MSAFSAIVSAGQGSGHCGVLKFKGLVQLGIVEVTIGAQFPAVVMETAKSFREAVTRCLRITTLE